MNRNILQSVIAMGILVGGAGFLLAFFQPQDSPEFIVSLCSGGIGLLLIILVITINRFLR